MLLPDTTTYSEFRENMAAHIRRLGKSRRATLVTKRGKPAMVTMSPAQYERLEAAAAEARTLAAIEEGLREIDDGKGVAWERVRRRLARKYGKPRA